MNIKSGDKSIFFNQVFRSETVFYQESCIDLVDVIGGKG